MKKHPCLLQADFAIMLGISRLHLIAIEQGRRRASAELAARWLAALAPEAKLDMFGDLPVVKRRARAFKRLQKAA
jgi:transcriptional regulator with XRE-family HTH domain